MDKQVYLASTSPRRKELLEKHGISFIIESVDTDETLDDSLPLSRQLEQVAYYKALPIANKHPHDIVIGADTMVLCNDEILGKAASKKEAKQMLEMLSNNRQMVYTSVCIIDDGEVIKFTDVSVVNFKELSSKQIDEYLDDDEWIGKAGAYAIQGKASQFIESVKGDKETVIGLPTRLIKNYLTKGTID